MLETDDITKARQITEAQGVPLLTWINFKPIMGKSVRWSNGCIIEVWEMDM